MTPLRVLILEDRADDTALMVYELRRAGIEPLWRCVQTEEDFRAALESDPEVILADYSLPQFNALAALRLLQQSGKLIPFIVVSGSIGEEVAVESIKQGADDYVLKDRLTRLSTAVKSTLSIGCGGRNCGPNRIVAWPRNACVSGRLAGPGPNEPSGGETGSSNASSW